MTPKKATTRQRAAISFRVTTGSAAAEGRFVIKAGKKVVGKGALNARGVAKVRIDRLKAGKHKLTVTYRGNSATKSDKARRTITIVRR